MSDMLKQLVLYSVSKTVQKKYALVHNSKLDFFLIINEAPLNYSEISSSRDARLGLASDSILTNRLHIRKQPFLASF